MVPFLVRPCDIIWNGRLTFPSLIQQFITISSLLISAIACTGHFFPLPFIYLFYLNSKCISLFFLLYLSAITLSYQLRLSWVRDQSFFDKRGIVCVQAGLRWVTIGLVPTPSSRTFGPSTTGGSPTQHHKKAHHI